jgi:hypothetical protein
VPFFSPRKPAGGLRREESSLELPGIRLHAGRLANLAAVLLRAEAFTLARHVFLSGRGAASVAEGSEEGRSLLAHEIAHVEQYRLYGVRRFLPRYLADYLAARFRGASHAEAYAAIPFEREAQERASAFQSIAPLRAGAAAVIAEGSPADPRRGA